MKKVIATIMAISLLVAFSEFANARVKYISKSELMQQADLVVSGKVTKLEQTDQIKKLRMGGGLSGKITNATIQIEKVIKGNTDNQYVIVEFIGIIEGLEPDVQDAQFGMGSKGTAYLKKLSSGHYEALGGWINGWVL